MSSFFRKQYQEMYNFARAVFYIVESRNLELEEDAIRIMKACEGVLGQQSDFPPEARDR